MPEVEKRFDFHIGDHFKWIQDGGSFAIVKDQVAPFLTKFGRRLLLFESPDGRSCKPASHPLVKDFSLKMRNPEKILYGRCDWQRQSGCEKAVYLLKPFAQILKLFPQTHLFHLARKWHSHPTHHSANSCRNRLVCFSGCMISKVNRRNAVQSSCPHTPFAGSRASALRCDDSESSPMATFAMNKYSLRDS